MKAFVRMAGCVAFSIFVVGVANAVTPREQLQSLTTQLQQSPADNALREKVIAAAAAVKPAPALPVDALKLMGKGQYLVQQAKTPDDFVAAAAAFSAAADLAPWNAAAYFNQGVAYEKALLAQKALAAFEWYLKAAPNAEDAQEVTMRMGGLEVAAAEQGKQRARAEWLHASAGYLKTILEGKRYNGWMDCVRCTKAMSEGSNWFTPPLTVVSQTSVAEIQDADPRIEISFLVVAGGLAPYLNKVSTVLTGRQVVASEFRGPVSLRNPGAFGIRWTVRELGIGSGNSTWWFPDQPTWLNVSAGGQLQYCTENCEKIPLGAVDPWEASPQAALGIRLMN